MGTAAARRARRKNAGPDEYEKMEHKIQEADDGYWGKIEEEVKAREAKRL